MRGQLDKIYSLRISAWCNGNITGEQEMKALSRKTADESDQYITVTFDSRCSQSWESITCVLMGALSNERFIRLSLDLPTSFYLRGRSNWGYLASNLPEISYMSPYGAVATAGRRDDDVFLDWISRIQDPDCSDDCS